MAPEMIHPTGIRNPFQVTRLADIWSLGICFYYLVFGYFPEKHQGHTLSEILFNIREAVTEILYPKEFSRWVEGLSEILKELGFLDSEPDRPPASSEEALIFQQRSKCLNLVYTIIGCLKMNVLERWSATEIVGMLNSGNHCDALNLLFQKKEEALEAKLLAKTGAVAIRSKGINGSFLEDKFRMLL